MVGAIVKEGTQHGSRLNMECLKLTDVNKKKKVFVSQNNKL